jgi:hypothetical protein
MWSEGVHSFRVVEVAGRAALLAFAREFQTAVA